MPVKRFGPFKLKNKVGRMGYEIKNPDGSPMPTTAIRLIKDQSANNKVFIEVDYFEEEPKKTE